MPVVTLSREYGAGGLVVGQRVAELLPADLYDSMLIAEVAWRLQLPEETVERLDERREGIVLRLLRAMQTTHPEYAALPPLTDDLLRGGSDPEAVARVVAEVVEEAARTDRAVVVGRGSVMILAEWPGVVHVRLVAPRDVRIRRVAARAGTDEAAAARQVDAADKERTGYLKHLFGEDGRDPLRYSLVVNTATVEFEAAAQLIVQLVQRCGRPAA